MRALCGVLTALALGPALAEAAPRAYVPVCCNADSTVSVIATGNHRVLGSFAAGAGSYAVAFPDATTAWVTNGDNTISIVSLLTGRVRKTLQLKLTPWLIQVSHDGSRVYVVTGMFTGSLQHYSSTLEEFDASTGALTGRVSLPNDGLMNPGLAIAPDDSRVYATFDSQTIVVYDVLSGTTAATWQTSRALAWIAVGTLTLSPDGATLFTAGTVLTAIDTATGNVLRTVEPPGGSTFYSFVGSATTADGNTVYASYAAQFGAGSGLVTLDAATLSVQASVAVGSELLQPVLSRDGATLYIPDWEDSLLYVVSTADLSTKTTIALTGPIHSATLNAPGSALAVPNASTANALAVDATTMAVVASIGVSGTGNPQIGKYGATNASATAGGSRVFVAGVESNSISTINTATNKTGRVFTTGSLSPSVTGTNTPGIMATPDGRQIYLLGSDFQTQISEIDTATGAVNGISCPIGLGCQVTSMTALPDSSRVYLAGFGYGVITTPPFFFVVDTATLKVIAAPRIRDFGAMAAAPSGAYLYIAAGAAISIFDTAQNTLTGFLPVAGVVTAIAFSPDGTKAYAATGSTLDVIDTAAREVIATVPLGVAAASLAVSPDGAQVWVTSARSTSVVVVNMPAGTTQTVDFGLTVTGGVAFGGR